ncbi:ribonuclease H-like domain-containing protein [Tanacetum coccineum]
MSISQQDLYPVTAPSPIPHAFFVSQHTWHQRLGHPRGEVLRRLVSSNFISYNKEKSPVLCHAYQLGKHTFLDDTFVPYLPVRNPTLTTPTIRQIDPLPHQQHPTELAAQQSPITAQPTPASPSLAQIYSPAQQPSHVAQHTLVQLHFSSTTVPHQTTTVSDQHAPVIVQNPSDNPNPDSVHPMVMYFRVVTHRPTEPLNLHVPSIFRLPKSYHDAFNDPNWQNAMRDEYTALIKNKTWTLVPRPPDTNIVRWSDTTCYCMLVILFSQLLSESLLQQIIRSLHQEFAMIDLGPLNYFLGISVTRDSSRLFLSQKKYAIEILDRAHMDNCNPSQTPIDTESKLGSDDISYAIQQVCLYMHDPWEPHFSALKRILRYARGTLNYGLQLFSSSSTDLVAYSDADWVGCPTTCRSSSGYCVFLGNNLLSWSSKRQPTLSHSSTKAEYRGVANAVAETCWLRNLLCELHTPLSSATLVYCDNVSAVYLSCNSVQHHRTKHTEIDIHFVCDLVAAGQVRVLHVPSRYQFADIFTKGLPSALFEEFRYSLSVRSPLALTVGECEGINAGIRSSKFCLHPAGDTPSSNRLFDAIMSHCVPVIVSDHIEPPFESELDYSKFTLFFSVKEALIPGYMVKHLRKITQDRWLRMWKRLKEITHHFEYQYDSTLQRKVSIGLSGRV